MTPRGLGAVLNDLAAVAMLFVLAAILTTAMVLQYAYGEIPCPLCLLQRVVMLGVCLAILRDLRDGFSHRNMGIAVLFSVLLLVISVRQTLLDIYPRPGHAYIGSAVLGLHMPVWSTLIATALLIAFGLRLAVLGDREVAPHGPGLVRAGRAIGLYVAALCAINFVSVVVQCGLGQCHTTGYRLLG